MKINVVIRVYDRLDDLEVCLQCVRRFWNRNEYRVIVVFNGKEAGFSLPEPCQKMADSIVELPLNAGHHVGSSQLLVSGIQEAPADAPYTVLLEADTWVLSDKIIGEYAEKLRNEKAVWASAEWVEKVHSLALDFAIVETRFLKEHPGALRFDEAPESSICLYLRRNGLKYLFLKECMPVHVPKLMRYFHASFGGRRRSFSQIPMVTHHIEDLPGGILSKKRLANIAAASRVFQEAPAPRALEIAGLGGLEFLIKACPRSGWFKAKDES